MLTITSLAREYGCLFNSDEWLELYGDKQQRVGLFEDGGELIGGFTIYRQRRWGLTLLTNPPFTPTCGPFVKVKASHGVAVMETCGKS